jgi:hypothetical protein
MGTVSIWVHPPEEIPVGIDGVSIEIHGIRAMDVPPTATRIELPTFRDACSRQVAGRDHSPRRSAVANPDVVLEHLVEFGLAVRRSIRAGQRNMACAARCILENQAKASTLR